MSDPHRMRLPLDNPTQTTYDRSKMHTWELNIDDISKHLNEEDIGRLSCDGTIDPQHLDVVNWTCKECKVVGYITNDDDEFFNLTIKEINIGGMKPAYFEMDNKYYDLEDDKDCTYFKDLYVIKDIIE